GGGGGSTGGASGGATGAALMGNGAGMALTDFYNAGAAPIMLAPQRAVVDLSDPGDPRLTGTLPLPAVGEQLYVLPGGYVVLLARVSPCASLSGRVILV